MKYKYIDQAIYSPTAFKLAEWMSVENGRIKASKLYKLVFKYEKLWMKNNRYKLDEYDYKYMPLNLLPPTTNPRPPRN